METFKLVKIIPIGYKIYDYSNKNCPLCRESFIDSKKIEVINDNNIYYHDKCLQIIKNNEKMNF